MRKVLCMVAVAIPSLVLMVARADTYPSRPVRIIVPFGVGSAGDIVARLVAMQLSADLGRPFVVDNRTGASGTIGAELAYRAPADGHTLVLSSAAMAITASAYPGLNYDSTRFRSITVMTHSALALAANVSLPVASVAQFVEYAKANPGRISFGSLGIATSHHVTAEKLKLDTGVQMVHIPYKGSGAAHTDLIGGHIQVMFDNVVALLPHFRSGTIRPLAVSSRARHPLLPGVPTLAESGVKDFEAVVWTGLAAPPGTPSETIGRLNAAAVQVLAKAEIRARLIDGGFAVIGNSAQEADEFLRSEIERWGAVIRSAKITLTP